MSNPVETKAPLFERIGGMVAVEAAVSRFYERLLGDPETAHFFSHLKNLDHLKSLQVKFLAQAMGGPANYKGRDMKKAHEKLSITKGDFDRVVLHLVETLKSLNVPKNLIDEILGLLGPLAKDIIKQ